jgi:hypothetical protein
VKPGSSRELFVYFEGGGACWNDANCDVAQRATFNPALDATDDPTNKRGIFDITNPTNPVRDYTMVFVAYCTGDVFLGSKTVTYTAKSGKEAQRTYQIQHDGFKNAVAAMDWITAHLYNPEFIFVSGSSAGAIPSPLFAAELAGHYKKARVVQLGDGAGAFRTKALPGILAGWGAIQALQERYEAFRSLDPASITFNTLYLVAAKMAPKVRYAQYNNVEDMTQTRFLEQMGMRDTKLATLLGANLEEIRRENSKFRTFTAPGTAHTILMRPDVYTLKVENVRFLEWLDALLQGEKLQDVGDDLLAVSSPGS